jgi:hypothetical protein
MRRTPASFSVLRLSTYGGLSSDQLKGALQFFSERRRSFGTIRLPPRRCFYDCANGCTDDANR